MLPYNLESLCSFLFSPFLTPFVLVGPKTRNCYEIMRRRLSTIQKSKWEFAMARNLSLALLIYSILDDYFTLDSKLLMRSMVNSEASIQTLSLGLLYE
jgi:hypothetical protein